MPLDRDKVLALPARITRHTYTKRDTVLYALGIGAAELDHVYETRLKVIPTMAVILGYPGFEFWQEPNYGFNWKHLLHGEQSIDLHRELPAEGKVVGRTRIVDIIDKGADKGAIALVQRDIETTGGELLATVRSTSFLRGDGGCGGPSTGAPVPHALPEHRAPDFVIETSTATNQALIYRLSGDLNPLHIDPELARQSGFPRPILHGLCTYGIVGRAVTSAIGDDASCRLRRLDARFSAPVFPGETITTLVWDEGHGRYGFQAFVVERGVRVISNGYAEVS